MTTAALLRRFWPWIAAILSGVLLALCFPNWNASQLIWVWQMPLLAALWFGKPSACRRPWLHGLRIGYVAGLTFFLMSLTWLLELGRTVQNSWAGIGAWIGLAAYLAVYFAAWGAFAATAGRWIPRDPDASQKGVTPGDLFGPSVAVLGFAALNAGAWCGLEWLRARLFTGFGWNGLGVALHDNIFLIQFADTIGVTGLAFVIVLCNAVWLATLVRIGRELQERLRVRPHLDFAVAVALIIVLFLYGTFRVVKRPDLHAESAVEGKDFVELRALLVQLNNPIDRQWTEETVQETLDRYRFFTRDLGVEFSDFDLVIWPETALPGRFTFQRIQHFLNEEILNAGDFTLVMGGEEEEMADETIYNSVLLMRGSTRNFESHRKIHLVPFGEYVPFRPLLGPILEGMVPADFTAGNSTEPLRMTKPDIGIIPLVCFEDTMGRLARQFIRPEPQLMVNVSNDGWFWQSAEPAQHLANAVFRCIELRRPMARAANTGISCFVSDIGSLEDPDPRATEGLSGYQRLRRVQDPETGNTFVEGTHTARLRLAKNPPITFFARYGDAFSLVTGSLAWLTGLTVCLRARRRRSASIEPQSG